LQKIQAELKRIVADLIDRFETAWSRHLCVQFNDILYTMFRDILYTFMLGTGTVEESGFSS